MYRTITHLTDRAGAEVFVLDFALPNDVELRAHFSPISPNVQRRLRATGVRPAISYQTRKTTPKKRGVAKGGRHGKQYLEAD